MTVIEPIKFLIVVPTLNSYALLNKLVDSLISQSYPSWRLVFIDGYSNKNHRKWLDNCTSKDKRLNWQYEIPTSNKTGIFNAMNQGFSIAEEDEWVLFWGSDDWAYNKDTFYKLSLEINNTLKSNNLPDLLIAKGIYFNSSDLRKERITSFDSSTSFRLSMFLGSTPPHQATVFGPKIRKLINSYSLEYKLTADLDYFLRISKFNNLKILSSNLTIVSMLNSGVSSRQTSLRLYEVLKSYFRSFGLLLLFPFLFRYLRKIFTLIKSKYLS